jgi:hypothetical protein
VSIRYVIVGGISGPHGGEYEDNIHGRIIQVNIFFNCLHQFQLVSSSSPAFMAATLQLECDRDTVDRVANKLHGCVCCVAAASLVYAVHLQYTVLTAVFPCCMLRVFDVDPV